MMTTVFISRQLVYIGICYELYIKDGKKNKAECLEAQRSICGLPEVPRRSMDPWGGYCMNLGNTKH